MGWRRLGQRLKPKGVGLKGHMGREVFWGKKKDLSWWHGMPMILGSLEEI